MNGTVTGWRKSRRSMSDGHCLEAGQLPEGVAVRDTKDRAAGPVLTFSSEAWDNFLYGIKQGAYLVPDRAYWP